MSIEFQAECAPVSCFWPFERAVVVRERLTGRVSGVPDDFDVAEVRCDNPLQLRQLPGRGARVEPRDVENRILDRHHREMATVDA